MSNDFENTEERTPAESPEAKGMRLARFLAKTGIGSRRSCEEYIKDGRVTVNGEAVTEVGTCVVPGEDVVCFEGKQVTYADSDRVYLMLNKPAGYTCSSKDVHAANLVSQLIPERFGRLFTVGRLDRESEGLLLLTNDGDFAQRLSHPSHEIYKRYYVECYGRFTTAIRRKLLDGMYDNGEFLRALNVEQVSVQHGSCKLIFTLGEGRKREIRRLCKDVGLTVMLLRRIAVGQLKLDEKLTVGSWRIMSRHDCELAMQPIEVPERAAPSEPPKPYWVKEKPERREGRPRPTRESAERRGPAPRKRDNYRKRRNDAPAQPPRPWYDESDAQSDEAPRSPRAPRGGYERGGYGRGGYDDEAPRGGYGRGSYDRGGSSRGSYERGGYDDEAPRGGYERGGYDDDAPRGGSYGRGGYDDEAPRGGYERGGSSRGGGYGRGGSSRGGYGGGSSRGGKKPSRPSSGGSGFRRNQPPRSWR